MSWKIKNNQITGIKIMYKKRQWLMKTLKTERQADKIDEV